MTSESTFAGARRARLIVALFVLLVALTALQAFLNAKPAEARIRGVLDANCRGEWAWTSGYFDEYTYKAQTFAAVHTGKLTEARLKFKRYNYAEGGVKVQIRTLDPSGAPSSTVLASTTIPRSAMSRSWDVETAHFDPARAARVVSGQRYALVTKASEGYHIKATEASSCPGSHYYAPLSGSPFTESTLSDLLFSVYVVPDSVW